MKRLILLAVAVGLLGAARPAAAWSMAGHMVTGAVAYEALERDDPAALAAVLKLLRAHPSYEKLWRPKLDKVPAEDRDLLLFMLAPRWADDIRKDPVYDKPTWHYVSHYYTPPGHTAPATVPRTPAVNAVSMYEESRKRMTAAAEPTDRAVALTWVFHLIGDIHQPMHTTSLYTADYPQPDGDRGGNRFWVRSKPDGKAFNLHYFWDGLLTNTEDFQSVRNTATELRLRPEFARDKLTELTATTFDDWKDESRELAKTAVYKGGKLTGGTAEFSAAVLPEDYGKESKAVAERRGVLAGYRLAAVLKEAFGAKPGREE